MTEQNRGPHLSVFRIILKLQKNKRVPPAATWVRFELSPKVTLHKPIPVAWMRVLLGTLDAIDMS